MCGGSNWIEYAVDDQHRPWSCCLAISTCIKARQYCYQDSFQYRWSTIVRPSLFQLLRRSDLAARSLSTPIAFSLFHVKFLKYHVVTGLRFTRQRILTGLHPWTGTCFDQLDPGWRSLRLVIACPLLLCPWFENHNQWQVIYLSQQRSGLGTQTSSRRIANF